MFKERVLAFCVTIAIVSCFKYLLRGNVAMRGVIKGYDILLAFSLLIVIYIFSESIIKNVSQYKGNTTWGNVIFVSFSVFLLIFPLTKISSEQISSVENRRLNAFPSFIVNDIFNYDYGKQFEGWLNDHFRGRDKVLKYNSQIEAFLAGRIENEQAFEGKNNWLFYKGDNSIANFQNLNNFSDDELRNIKERLEAKRDYCATIGAKYYVFIAPDKNKIYGEYYPAHYHQANEIGRGEQLYKYLKINSDLNIIYPLHELLVAKNKQEIYYKNDTHWNTVGAFVGYQELIKVIRKDYPELKPFNEDDFIITEKAVGGDLQNMLNLKERKYTTAVLNFKKRVNYSQKEEKAKTELVDAGRSYVITDNIMAKYNVIVFRDSFCSALQPLLSQQFGHVEYLWTRNFFGHRKLLKSKKPDIVIDETVERYAQGLVN